MNDIRASLDNITEDYNFNQFAFDLLEALASKMGTSLLLHEDGKIRPIFRSVDMNTPWVFVRPKPGLNCHIWHEILFKGLGVFPPGCRDCWKVVVKPRNFKELMQLMVLQEEHSTRYCKCGFEERPYVHVNWGGYFYCTGEAEGHEVYAEVRAMVDNFISPDVPVILKRYCTEYEMRFGPSDQYSAGRDAPASIERAETWAGLVDKFVDMPKANGTPGLLKLHTIKRWIQKAYERGDQTVREFNMTDEEGRANDGHIYKSLVTYHNKEKK